MSPSARPRFAADRTARWSTFGHERVVLAVVHNITAATRLFDTLPVLATDPRIRIVFTRTGSSAFDRGTTEFLARRGVTEISWGEACRNSFDLALSASYGGELHRIDAPLFVIPHGMGYNKYLNKETKKQRNKETKKQRNNSVFGLSAEWLLHEGALVPTAIVLSHNEQRDRLISAVPAAAPRALVAGDICFDQLSASLPLRASYRRAYGLPAHRKLLVISSTWGSNDALLARHPKLPLRLAESLPADKFQIVIAAHPNIAAEHSSWQLGEYLAAATRAGVHLLDDVDAWKAAVVAADLVLGDHGSIPFYATALGVAPLLATAPAHALDPASPIAGFLATAPHLDLDGDLAAQIEAAITDHDPGRYTAHTALTTSHPLAGAAILRRAMYETMDLPEPDAPAELPAAPLPRAALPRAQSHLVLVRSAEHGTAQVTRYPAERLSSGTDLPRGAHLAVGVNEPLHRWLRLADIMIGAPGPDTRRWITDTLHGLPGCRLAAAPVRPGEWLIGIDPSPMDTETPTPSTEPDLLTVTGSDDACRLFASITHHHLARTADPSTLAGTWTIECAGVSHRVSADPTSTTE
ncbi:hypothetical protein ACFVVM_27475 [Nocardia sp. NPDC058176]|uniref:hypothetical protein n=1 Tax=Nocardia sp. NPDC058176 TaxID=3346368 RepID=UPI0036DC7212